MIITIIAVIGIFIYGICNCIREHDYEYICLCILLSLLAGTMLWVGTFLVGTCLPDDYYEWTTAETPIYALADTSNASGRHFLGVGTVKEIEYYYYIVETEYGYKKQRVPTSEAYIKYTDEKPYLATSRTCGFAREFPNIYALPENRCIYTFYVPEGTIVQNYIIDLQ